MRKKTAKYQPADIVKSCYKLESGLRLGQEGIHACQLGPFSSPIYYTAEEAGAKKLSKSDLIEKRQWIFDLLNDPKAETPCKRCDMVVEKSFSEVRFDQLGHIDLAATTTCNLRCNFCGYTHLDSFADARYDALEILKEFEPQDVVWNSAVDFNGGEPTILKDFDEYIRYFESRKIRVFLFTNGLIYRDSVYAGLMNGTVRWACVSLDAGTSSTYDRTKKSTKFHQVLENIARYSHAGSQGGGAVSVKYIFTEDNLGDDDNLGFVYAMMALRPQEIWLTFDFDPLCDLPADAPNFGGYDYSEHIDAYVKMYRHFLKHGVRPIHYAEKHLAPASLHGKMLLKMVKERLQDDSENSDQTMLLPDFRSPLAARSATQIEKIKINGSQVWQWCDGNWIEDAQLRAEPVVLAPSPLDTYSYIERLTEAGIRVFALLDRDKILHGKTIRSVTISSYEDAAVMAESNFLVRCAPEIREAVIQSILNYAPSAKISVDVTDEESPLERRKKIIRIVNG